MNNIKLDTDELVSEIKTILINHYDIAPNDEFIEEIVTTTAFREILVSTLAGMIYKLTTRQKIISDEKEFRNGFYLLKTRKIKFGEIREKLISEGYILCTKSELDTFVKENPDQPRINRIVSLAEKEITDLGHSVYPTIVHKRRPRGNALSTVHMFSNNSGYRILVRKK